MYCVAVRLFHVLHCSTFVSCTALQYVCFVYCIAIRLFHVLRCSTFVSCTALQYVCFVYCVAVRLFRVLHCSAFVSCIALQYVCSMLGIAPVCLNYALHPGQGYKFPFSGQFRAVVDLQSKGELGGPGDLVIQDRLVANTQRSIGLNLADFLGTKVSALLALVTR